jgi:arylsulfatase
MLFSGDETLDVGVDYGTSVGDDYTPDTSQFTGTVECVQLDTGSDDQSHLISPEDRLTVAMVRQ